MASEQEGVPVGFTPTDAGPFLDHVGPVFESADGNVVAIRIGEQHLNRGGSAHGGLLATLMDSAMGRAVRSQADQEAAATVSLTTDYLGPAAKGDWVEAHTDVERVGGRLAFVDASLQVEGREIVRGRAVFALLD